MTARLAGMLAMLTALVVTAPQATARSNAGAARTVKPLNAPYLNIAAGLGTPSVAFEVKNGKIKGFGSDLQCRAARNWDKGHIDSMRIKNGRFSGRWVWGAWGVHNGHWKLVRWEIRLLVTGHWIDPRTVVGRMRYSFRVKKHCDTGWKPWKAAAEWPLVVGVSSTPRTAVVPADVTNTVTVTNLGPIASKTDKVFLQLTGFLPMAEDNAHSTLSSVTSSTGTCDSTIRTPTHGGEKGAPTIGPPYVSCDLGVLQGYAHATMTVVEHYDPAGCPAGGGESTGITWVTARGSLGPVPVLNEGEDLALDEASWYEVDC